MRSSQPIGIFDSGIGGLTVAKAVKDVLPNESLIYFGDIAHLPYGDKSVAAIQAYAVRIADFLLKKNCKVVLIACNSASSAAYDLVVEFVGKKAKVFDVINPTVDFIRENYQSEKVGLIGTKQTVQSNVYAEKVNSLGLDLSFVSLPTPLLVPMIEEGIYSDEISTSIIHKYLSDQTLQEINSLILGCTHYPIIKSQIKKYFDETNREVEVIDSADTVAATLKGYLESYQLVAKEKTMADQFFVSDFTSSFESTTKLFFGEKVHLEHLRIWDEFN